MAKAVKKAVRLRGGGYRYRGRAVSFGKLPKREQHRFRSKWATKGAAPRKAKHREAKWLARQARKAYVKGDTATARAYWDQRDRTLPERWYYYHGD